MVRNRLGYTAEKPWDPPRCTGPVAESWRDAATEAARAVKLAWSAYAERRRSAGELESGALRADVEQYGASVEQLPQLPYAGSAEQYTAVAERAIASLKAAEGLMPKLGAKAATVGGSAGGYAVTAGLVGVAVVGGWWLLKGDG